MSTADVVVLVAAGVACAAAVVSIALAAVLGNQVRRFERALDALQHEVMPLVADAKQAAGAAATEMARVGAVLEDTEAVTATVDSATRLAQRAFANPVVKVLAFRAGAASGLRQLREAPDKRPKRARR
jgi:uncharacterized membrane protein